MINIGVVSDCVSVPFEARLLVDRWVEKKQKGLAFSFLRGSCKAVTSDGRAGKLENRSGHNFENFGRTCFDVRICFRFFGIVGLPF